MVKDPALEEVGSSSPAPMPPPSPLGEGFEALYRAHAPFVVRLLRNLGVREADVPDVAQDVFVVISRKLGEVELRSTLRAWIYGVCYRTAANYRRRSAFTRERLYAVPPEAAQSDRSGVRAAAKLDLLRALDRLSDAQRTIFVLYEVEQLTMAEVAEVVGCPPTTAYSRLYAARRSLREIFDAAAGATPDAGKAVGR